MKNQRGVETWDVIIADTKLSKKDQMNLGDYFGVGSLYFKKLIIMRVCRNDNYTHYKQWLINTYVEEELQMRCRMEW